MTAPDAPETARLWLVGGIALAVGFATFYLIYYTDASAGVWMAVLQVLNPVSMIVGGVLLALGIAHHFGVSLGRRPRRGAAWLTVMAGLLVFVGCNVLGIAISTMPVAGASSWGMTFLLWLNVAAQYVGAFAAALALVGLLVYPVYVEVDDDGHPLRAGDVKSERVDHAELEGLPDDPTDRESFGRPAGAV